MDAFVSRQTEWCMDVFVIRYDEEATGHLFNEITVCKWNSVNKYQ